MSDILQQEDLDQLEQKLSHQLTRVERKLETLGMAKSSSARIITGEEIEDAIMKIAAANKIKPTTLLLNDIPFTCEKVAEILNNG